MSIPSIKTLNKQRHITKLHEESIFDVILKKCVNEINTTHRHTKKTWVLFNVPRIVLEEIDYSADECVYYLINKFKTFCILHARLMKLSCYIPN